MLIYCLFYTPALFFWKVAPNAVIYGIIEQTEESASVPRMLHLSFATGTKSTEKDMFTQHETYTMCELCMVIF